MERRYFGVAKQLFCGRTYETINEHLPHGTTDYLVAE
jgi:hypothetical protein